MKTKFFVTIFLILILNACSLSPNNPTPTGIASIYPISTSELPSPIATKPVQLLTPIPPLVITQIVTEAPTEKPASPTPGSTSTISIPTTFQFSDGQYMDDRGSEYQFLLSYLNAIRQGLLPMAYYFWNDDSTLAGSYESFVQIYSGLKPDEVTVMKAGSSGAAGSIYTTFGVTLKGSRSGVPGDWAACYTLRTPNPALFDSKDFDPRHFVAENLLEIPAGESPKTALETACTGMDFGMLDISLSNSDSIALVDAKHYVDSRSDSVAIVSSFWNALNRQEYGRAYSYFEAPAIFPGPYITFKTGYLDTANVSGKITTPEKSAAAGNWYWKVPVTLNSETKAGVMQAFVGCYIIHQSNPELYGSPAFKPMAIQKAQFEAISPSADPTTIQTALASTCENLP